MLGRQRVYRGLSTRKCLGRLELRVKNYFIEGINRFSAEFMNLCVGFNGGITWGVDEEEGTGDGMTYLDGK